MKRRAFSLIEALITLALLSIALGAMASLMASMNRMQRNGDEKDRRMVLVLHALEMMRTEVEEAVEILPGPSTQYQFKKINPNTDTLLQNPADPQVRLVYALDAPGALDPLDTWESRRSSDLVTVTYHAAANDLVRECNGSAVLCEGISGFSVYRDAWGVDHLEISMLAGGVLRAYSAAVGSKLP
ncbi:MAG: type II secretion system protein [Candidatus Eremiobacteraeota bacterium]|nr:type II secretion system protein [Candidatus Eremiobacteraeota bacterium]MCW5867740.1 type II secretion system protein [Candidatus Eremiobacteraeota bacterium]